MTKDESTIFISNKEFNEVEKWAINGDVEAQVILGKMYYHGKGVSQDYKEAFKWFKLAAEQGSADAQTSLGDLYRRNKGVSRDYKEAFKWYSKAAEQGDVEAQYYLGAMYVKGYGAAKNYELAISWIKLAAEQGHVMSQFSLGGFYYEGIGVAQDNKEAFKWLEKAAEQGHADAQQKLGFMYNQGEGVAQDYKEGFKWLKLAAEQGRESAQVALGAMYFKGEGVTQSYKEAFKWNKLAAEQGSVIAQFSLGYLYCTGDDTVQDYAAAFKWFKLAAEQGLLEPQVFLSSCYLEGEGTDQDYEEAYFWACLASVNGDEDAVELKQMAEDYLTPDKIVEIQQRVKNFKPKVRSIEEIGIGQSDNDAKSEAKDIQEDNELIKIFRKNAEDGDLNAQYSLGCMLADGKDVAQDLKEAFKWLKKAAEQGHVMAQTDLGMRYRRGKDVAKDLEEAFKWYELAAEQGEPMAQYFLGVMYNLGEGIPQDYKKAIYWYSLAADQGDLDAQFRLGVIYTTEDEDIKDETLAATWFKRAAVGGHSRAQNNLSVLYAIGEGVEQDFEKAYYWAYLAAENGNKDSIKLRDSLEERLSPDKIKVVQQQLKGDFNPKADNLDETNNVDTNLEEKVKSEPAMIKALKESAEEGDAMAQLYLGFAYAEGDQVDRDLVEAYFWGSVAAENEYGDSVKFRNLTESLLSSDEITAVRQRVEDFMAKTKSLAESSVSQATIEETTILEADKNDEEPPKQVLDASEAEPADVDNNKDLEISDNAESSVSQATIEETANHEAVKIDEEPPKQVLKVPEAEPAVIDNNKDLKILDNVKQAQPTVVHPVATSSDHKQVVPSEQKQKEVAKASEEKSSLSAVFLLILAVFLGGFGIHRFYSGHMFIGLIYLFTSGLFGIGWVIDVLLIIFGLYKDKKGRPVRF